jgi:Tol biopolymer transport system component
VTFSPDKSRLVYMSSGNLYLKDGYRASGVVSPLSTGKRNLVTGSIQIDAGGIGKKIIYESLSWSPDNSRVAYHVVQTVEGESRTDIFVAAVDGNSEPINLTRDEKNSLDFSKPSWAPDGTRITYSRRADDRNPSDLGDISVVASDGKSAPVTLTTSAYAVNPTWSPNGDQIMFASGNPQKVFVIEPDGGSPAQISDRLRSGVAKDAVWSADGKRVAYVFTTGRGWDEHEICIAVSTTGETLACLNHGAGNEIKRLVWSPDGGSIAYLLKRRRLGPTLFIARSDLKSEPIRVATELTSWRGIFPEWSSDGTKLTFSSDAQGRTFIFLFTKTAAGESTSCLVNQAGPLVAGPVWTPDEKWITYSTGDIIPDVFAVSTEGGTPIFH